MKQLFSLLPLNGASGCSRLSALENGNGHSHAGCDGLTATNGHAHTNGSTPMNGHVHFDHGNIKLDGPVMRPKRDRTAFGLALYALSSCFLATMLVFAKRLGEPHNWAPTFIVW